MSDDPRILLAILERDLQNAQAGVTSLTRVIRGTKPEPKTIETEEDPKRKAMREKMRQKALQRWAAKKRKAKTAS